MVRTLIMVAVPFYREGLRELLARSGQVEVVGAVSDADSAESLARSARPDVLLLDVDSEPSVRVIRAMAGLDPAPRVVVLAISETPEVVMRWAEHGVTAYVSRDSTLEMLLRVIVGASRGELYCPPRIAACIMQRVGSLAAATPSRVAALGALSSREREVVSLVARGLSNKKVAMHLAISPATAKNHVHHILDKLHLHRRAELVAMVHAGAAR